MNNWAPKIVLGMLCMVAIACAKKEAAPPTADAIASGVSQAICKRAIECNPEAPVQVEECHTQTKQALSDLVTQKNIQISAAELESCLKAINEGACEEILNPNGPPKGCEKLQ